MYLGTSYTSSKRFVACQTKSTSSDRVCCLKPHALSTNGEIRCFFRESAKSVLTDCCVPIQRSESIHAERLPSDKRGASTQGGQFNQFCAAECEGQEEHLRAAECQGLEVEAAGSLVLARLCQGFDGTLGGETDSWTNIRQPEHRTRITRSCEYILGET